MLPLFHTFGLSSIYDYLNRGLCFVLIPRFTMKAMLETIQEFKITIVSLVPAIAVQLVKHPVEKYYDLSSIRFMFSGAAALGKDITKDAQQFYQRVPRGQHRHRHAFLRVKGSIICILSARCSSLGHSRFAKLPGLQRIG